MEFYSLTPSNLDKPLLFQFPTGWNSTKLGGQDIEAILKRFNSQRDGILPCRGSIIQSEAGSFQFPTGWNSTLADYVEYIDEIEFQFPTGWNSTKTLDHYSKL